MVVPSPSWGGAQEGYMSQTPTNKHSLEIKKIVVDCFHDSEFGFSANERDCIERLEELFFEALQQDRKELREKIEELNQFPASQSRTETEYVVLKSDVLKLLEDK